MSQMLTANQLAELSQRIGTNADQLIQKRNQKTRNRATRRPGAKPQRTKRQTSSAHSQPVRVFVRAHYDLGAVSRVCHGHY